MIYSIYFLLFTLIMFTLGLDYLALPNEKPLNTKHFIEFDEKFENQYSPKYKNIRSSPSNGDETICIKRILSHLRKQTMEIMENIDSIESNLQKCKCEKINVSRTETTNTKSIKQELGTNFSENDSNVKTDEQNDNQIEDSLTVKNHNIDPLNDELNKWDEQIDACKKLLKDAKLSERSFQESEIRERPLRIRSKKKRTQQYKMENGENWSDWSEWTPCSAVCGNGRQVRYRKCFGDTCTTDIEMDEKKCFDDCDISLEKEF